VARQAGAPVRRGTMCRSRVFAVLVAAGCGHTNAASTAERDTRAPTAPEGSGAAETEPPAGEVVDSGEGSDTSSAMAGGIGEVGGCAGWVQSALAWGYLGASGRYVDRASVDPCYTFGLTRTWVGAGPPWFCTSDVPVCGPGGAPDVQQLRRALSDPD